MISHNGVWHKSSKKPRLPKVDSAILKRPCAFTKLWSYIISIRSYVQEVFRHVILSIDFIEIHMKREKCEVHEYIWIDLYFWKAIMGKEIRIMYSKD